jgi:hypothetical protein
VETKGMALLNVEVPLKLVVVVFIPNALLAPNDDPPKAVEATPLEPLSALGAPNVAGCDVTAVPKDIDFELNENGFDALPAPAGNVPLNCIALVGVRTVAPIDVVDFSAPEPSPEESPGCVAASTGRSVSQHGHLTASAEFFTMQIEQVHGELSCDNWVGTPGGAAEVDKKLNVLVELVELEEPGGANAAKGLEKPEPLANGLDVEFVPKTLGALGGANGFKVELAGAMVKGEGVLEVELEGGTKVNGLGATGADSVADPLGFFVSQQGHC